MGPDLFSCLGVEYFEEVATVYDETSNIDFRIHMIVPIGTVFVG